MLCISVVPHFTFNSCITLHLPFWKLPFLPFREEVSIYKKKKNSIHDLGLSPETANCCSPKDALGCQRTINGESFTQDVKVSWRHNVIYSSEKKEKKRKHLGALVIEPKTIHFEMEARRASSLPSRVRRRMHGVSARGSRGLLGWANTSLDLQSVASGILVSC